MFIGHWAPAFVAAGVSHKAPRLGTLFVAAMLVDWAFFLFVLAGWEKMRFTPGISAMNPLDLYHMPYTHSLLGSLVFAFGFGLVLRVLTGDRITALIGAVVALSHWFLDLLVHVPDLTLAGSPPKLGLGLWNHPWAEMPLELGLILAALFWYTKKRRPAEGRVWVLAVLLAILQAIHWFGPTESVVTVFTSLLAFFAFGLAALTAQWVGESNRIPLKAL